MACDRSAGPRTGPAVAQLAQRVQLGCARTSRAITSLAAKELLRREPGVADRRQARLALTPKGQALFDELFPLVSQLNRGLLSPLEADELQYFECALDALQQQADRMVLAAELPKADRHRGSRLRPDRR